VCRLHAILVSRVDVPLEYISETSLSREAENNQEKTKKLICDLCVSFLLSIVELRLSTLNKPISDLI